MKVIGRFIERTAKKLFLRVALSLSHSNSKPSPFVLSTVKSVLLLRPDRLGDFVLAAPAIQTLQGNLSPRCRVTLIVGERAERFAHLIFPQFKILVFRKSILSRLALFARLRMGWFDAVIDLHSFPFSVTSSLMSLLPRSPHRVGFVDSGKTENPARQIFNHWVLLKDQFTHETEKNMMLVRKFIGKKEKEKNRLLFSVPADIRKQVKEFYLGVGIRKGDFVVGIHPTLSKNDNRWSQGKYLRLIYGLKKKNPIKIIVVWGKGEETLLEEFGKGSKGFPDIFSLPTSNLLFILEAARKFNLFVCNDSGLMHAVSLVTNVFAVFGPSNPAQWSPNGKKRIKIFRAFDKKCDSVDPRTVEREIEKTFFKRSRWKRGGWPLT